VIRSENVRLQSAEQHAPRFFCPNTARGWPATGSPVLGHQVFKHRTQEEAMDEFFSRGIAQAVVRQELVTLLKSHPPLRIKFGVDPSSPDLTLGHIVCFRKLCQLQELGHQVIVVIGDWTARIGDPSGRSKTRRMLDAATVNHNAESYLDQFFRFVDPNQTQVRFQSEWFGSFNLQDVIGLTRRFTVAQMMARDDFRTRFAAGRPISIAEFMYALLQAFDSVALQADVELGGNDQLFNVLVGRTIMKEYDLPPQHIITVPILVGTDGVEKMGKSTGNYIAVTAAPNEMFGAIMSLPDTAMHDYFMLLTDLPEVELAQLEREMAAGALNPRDVKLRLAQEIVGAMHDAGAAQQARAEFLRVYSHRQSPSDIPTFSLHQPTAIVKVLARAGLTRSKGEARRLIRQGGVRLDGQRINDIHAYVSPPPREMPATAHEGILRVGRRRFLRIVGTQRNKETR
jgi:tyrosyl-tRNA synthetase